jgi:subtilisin family serine protease
MSDDGVPAAIGVPLSGGGVMMRTAVVLLVSVALLLVSASSAGAARPTRNRPPYVPGQVIVKFASDATAGDVARIRAGLGGTRVKGLGHAGLELRSLGRMGVEAAVAKYRHHPRIAYIEPNYLVHALGVPNDPFFPQLHALRNLGQLGGTPGADISAVEAWDVFTGSSGVLIGVIDSGVDYLHPDLAANMWTNPGEIPGNGIDDDGNGYVDDVHGYDFYNDDGDPMDDNGHGTHIAGTIGAVGNNALGVTGVNWNVGIMALKFLGSSGTGTTADAIEAINYAVMMGAPITDNSWGGGGFSQALLDAINAADAAGDLFVTSAGGSGRDNDLYPSYPASYASPNIVAVAATDADDNLASFSGYGATSVDLAAPGADILSTYPGNSYRFYSGTSMATAHVTGALGLVLGRFSGIGHLEAKGLVLDNVDVKPGLAGKCLTGGRLNAYLPIAVTVVEAAATDVEPNTLNLGGSGDWVTAYVELPAEIDPAGVVLETVRLNDAEPADPDRSRMGDWNRNKIADWAFKFDRASVAAVLPEGESVPVTVAGDVGERTRFEGTDAIRVILPRSASPNRGELFTAGLAPSPPAAVRLHAGAPNPFTDATRIRFDLPEAVHVRARVFDLRGRLVRTLADRAYPAGSHQVIWDGRDAGGRKLPAGVYFCRLEAGGRASALRVTLVRE